ncbi:MAG: hypothetical protein ACJ75R_04515 [Solirubrobacterales bacterium]
MSRERFDHLDDAVAALERSAESIRGEGGLEGVSLVRDFAPGDRVAARLEVSTGRWFRSRTAGVDVMGDGSLVAFAGGMTRTELEPRDSESPFDAVRRELGGSLPFRGGRGP